MKNKITPKQAKQALDDPFYKLEKVLDRRFDEMKKIFRDYRDQILTKMDKVMGELDIHRIDQDGIKSDIKSLKNIFQINLILHCFP